MRRLTLYEPVDRFVIYQQFGENEVCSYPDRTGIVSIKHWNALGGKCPEGKVKFYPLLGMKGHTGMDVRGDRWQPLYASCEGFVEEVQTEPERGLGLGIITKNKYDSEYGEQHFKVRYWHLAAMLVKAGDKVQFGQHIGWCDNTGLSSGDHLHFELKPVAKNSQGVWYNILQDNGYYGAVDPEPYLIHTNAKKLRGVIRKMREILAISLEKLADFAR